MVIARGCGLVIGKSKAVPLARFCCFYCTCCVLRPLVLALLVARHGSAGVGRDAGRPPAADMEYTQMAIARGCGLVNRRLCLWRGFVVFIARAAPLGPVALLLVARHG
jgi:hypothetical protein